MRLDKYLKVSRIIKRRTVAKEVVDNGHVLLNQKACKASTDVNEGDILTITHKGKRETYRIEKILEYATEEKAKEMYSLLKEETL